MEDLPSIVPKMRLVMQSLYGIGITRNFCSLNVIFLMKSDMDETAKIE